MNLKDIHDFIDFILQKERGAFLSPEEKDNVLDRAQWWLYNEDFDFYAKNQEIRDSLSTFSTKAPFTSDVTGLVQLPNDITVKPCYEHLLSMNAQYFDNKQQIIRYKGIRFFAEDEIAERLDSQILRPTITDPIGEELSAGAFQLYPKVSMSGTVYYLRAPVKPFFSYTLGTDGRTITYVPGTSVQLEWEQGSLNKIIIKALQLCGVNVGDDMIIQYTSAKDQQDV